MSRIFVSAVGFEAGGDTIDLGFEVIKPALEVVDPPTQVCVDSVDFEIEEGDILLTLPH